MSESRAHYPKEDKKNHPTPQINDVVNVQKNYVIN